jgi:hypothetical protein
MVVVDMEFASGRFSGWGGDGSAHAMIMIMVMVVMLLFLSCCETGGGGNPRSDNGKCRGG